MRICAYRNLKYKGVVWSLAEYKSAKSKGKVIGYQPTVILEQGSFRHGNPSALKRIREGHREVCAWVSGVAVETADLSGLKRVLADPRKHDTFKCAESGETLTDVDLIVLNQDGCFYR